MKTISIHAEAAKAIRQELKKAFPHTKFSVRSKSFSGGDSVHIEWTDGPTTRQITAITDKYQYGHFDGMIDLYEISNSRSDIPQVKYVQRRRDYSDAVMQGAFEHCRRKYEGWEHLTHINQTCEKLKDNWHVWTPREFIYRLVEKQDLTQGLNYDR